MVSEIILQKINNSNELVSGNGPEFLGVMVWVYLFPCRFLCGSVGCSWWCCLGTGRKFGRWCLHGRIVWLARNFEGYVWCAVSFHFSTWHNLQSHVKEVSIASISLVWGLFEGNSLDYLSSCGKTHLLLVQTSFRKGIICCKSGESVKSISLHILIHFSLLLTVLVRWRKVLPPRMFCGGTLQPGTVSQKNHFLLSCFHRRIL